MSVMEEATAPSSRWALKKNDRADTAERLSSSAAGVRVSGRKVPLTERVPSSQEKLMIQLYTGQLLNVRTALAVKRPLSRWKVNSS